MVVSRRFWMLLVAVMLAGACSDLQIGPSCVTGTCPPPPPPPPPSPSVYRGLVIDEDDRPVAGAAVTHFAFQTATTLVTDADGAFEFTVESPQQAPRAHVVTVERAGHEPSTGWVTTSCCERTRLYRIREIAAGATITLPVFGGAYCGREYEVPCRRVRVRSPHGGTLKLEVGPPDTFWVLPADATAFLNPPNGSSLSVPVTAQTVTEVDVWVWGRFDDTGTAFTLTTSVQ